LDKIGKYIGKDTIECGAGSGSFAKSILTKYKTNYTGLEPSKNVHKHLEANLTEFSNTEFLTKSLPNFFEEVQSSFENQIDTIIYNNVLEHIKDDQKELNLAYKTLKKAGHILTFSPAMQVLYSDYDNSIGHFRRYVLEEMINKVKQSGFEVVEAHYFDFVGSFLWYLKYKILKSSGLTSNSLSVYDKFVIPILRKIEPSKILPFGKNIVVIGKK